MAAGETRDAILKTYPYIESDDIDEAEVRTRLGEILATLTEADIARSIIVVDRDRARRRRLPIGDERA
jgi:hypothetical protein